MERGETKFGRRGNIDVKARYFSSFGFLPEGTCYSDPMGLKTGGAKIDIRPTLGAKIKSELKALGATSGGAGTAGYAMVPVYLDPNIVDTTRKYTPLVELIPRVTNMGTTADYNKITAKTAAAWLPESSALTTQDTTYDRASTSIKYGYSVGEVTGPAIAAYPAYSLTGFTPTGATSPFAPAGAPNAKQLEVIVRTRALREAEESEIVNGDTSSNPDGFQGIVQLQGSTNKLDKNTAAVMLDDLYTAVRYAYDDGGRPNLAVCSSDVFTDVEKLMTDYMRVPPTVALPWGFQTLSLRTMVGEIPIVPSMYLSNTSGSKAIYFMDMSVWEMRVLQDVTYEELAKTSDQEKFMLKVYEALICRNTAFNGFVGEISA